VVADRKAHGRRVQFVRDEASGQVLGAIAGDHATEWIAFAPSARGPIETDALVAVYAVDQAGEVERELARGTYMHVDTVALARLGSALHSVAAR
jgi:hypothetical protein